MKSLLYSVRHTKASEELQDDEHDGFEIALEQPIYDQLLEVGLKSVEDEPLQRQFTDAVEYLTDYARTPSEELDEEAHTIAHMLGAIILHCVRKGVGGVEIQDDVVMVMDELDVGGGYTFWSKNNEGFDLIPED